MEMFVFLCHSFSSNQKLDLLLLCTFLTRQSLQAETEDEKICKTGVGCSLRSTCHR